MQYSCAVLRAAPAELLLMELTQSRNGVSASSRAVNVVLFTSANFQPSRCLCPPPVILARFTPLCFNALAAKHARVALDNSELFLFFFYE